MFQATPKRFRNRRQAGALLGASLREVDALDPLVLGLLRGGIPVAYEVARTLNAPLDVFLVRKLGVPGQTELALGAVAEGGVQVFNQRVISQLGLSDQLVDGATRQQEEELLRRARSLRGERPPCPIQGRTVFLIDDGLATGATMRAAILALSYKNPHEIVPAVPVAPQQTIDDLQSDPPAQAGDSSVPVSSLISRTIALLTPSPFWGVGAWYDDFSQVSDAEVARLLAAKALPGRPGL